ncbi:hypothetical protein E1286_39340 [Nonomuraea terrae]|uniref:Lipoprotein n=1 Tax=Nonomuraea terrae TaxID=2530383 RepID=A0A4R4XVS3_9ACTN|nr:hypothetical protein [Nonomuraea terrae]TDD35576.1 hypothetical protein E1286_39340 [Nonomuraea terrae]
MRKTISVLVVCGAFLVGTAPAQAAPKDPVRVLKSTLTPGHGVRYTEIANWSDGVETSQAYDTKGVLQFGKKGLAAYDIASSAWDDEKDRVIYNGKATYYSGALAGELPNGKTWLEVPGGGGMPSEYDHVLDPTEPTTLSALLKKGGKSGNTVTGTITFGELRKVSAWFSRSDPRSWASDTEVSYKLTLSSAGLVSRLWSSYTAKGVSEGYEDFEGSTAIVDTRYTDWGAKVSVKTPSPKTVTE